MPCSFSYWTHYYTIWSCTLVHVLYLYPGAGKYYRYVIKAQARNHVNSLGLTSCTWDSKSYHYLCLFMCFPQSVTYSSSYFKSHVRFFCYMFHVQFRLCIYNFMFIIFHCSFFLFTCRTCFIIVECTLLCS
ncbi:leucine-rich repeat extensin-like protein 3 [Iris pallida]|uniref:Leucine-rich repeat extensin-like protein 3 n=1 Tax=Iris pallida TaxID=29817 RepID=A0AAX6HNQ9_IRIPA|nr:leucine-rich repeat extensin-like protein 3 [Iris pallida]KAJ6842442.1 leucine-rich repeat extensin-like protein 3 [Iris pallida]